MAEFALLIYNVSHDDLLVAVDGKQIARPRSNTFHAMGEWLLEVVNGSKQGVNCDGVPAGFVVESAMPESFRYHDLYFRDPTTAPSSIFVTDVYFPLLTTILTKWTACPSKTYFIYLVSGASSQETDSTRSTSDLLAIFIHINYPNVQVIQIHSKDLYHYDDNVALVTQQLLPDISEKRKSLMSLLEVQRLPQMPTQPWRDAFHVTMSPQ